MAYGLPQRCALITIAMKGGEAKNNALKLDKPGRDRLENDRLITVDKRKTPFTLRLTDNGWRAFEDEMVAEPPPRSGSAGPALYETLHALSALLSRESRSAREAFGHGPASTRNDAQNMGAGAARIESTRKATPVDPETMVRQAYSQIAKQKRDWVELADLRTALPGMPREELDSVLIHMLTKKQIEMTAHEDQGRLTSAQRDAALKVGRMQMHLVSMSQ